jgi:hypothetical protein
MPAPAASLMSDTHGRMLQKIQEPHADGWGRTLGSFALNQIVAGGSRVMLPLGAILGNR